MQIKLCKLSHQMCLEAAVIQFQLFPFVSVLWGRGSPKKTSSSSPGEARWRQDLHYQRISNFFSPILGLFCPNKLISHVSVATSVLQPAWSVWIQTFSFYFAAVALHSHFYVAESLPYGAVPDREAAAAADDSWAEFVYSPHYVSCTLTGCCSSQELLTHSRRLAC